MKSNANSLRKYRLKSHGWSERLVLYRFNEQKGLCAICGIPMHRDGKMDSSKACADHRHSNPPKPRGLLCPRCNAGLGYFLDNPQFLSHAVTYLRFYE